jgi:hypothetical protein
MPDTVIVDGYGLALPAPGMAIGAMLDGITSSETIVPVAEEGVPTEYPLPASILNVTVSLLGSATVSAIGVTRIMQFVISKRYSGRKVKVPVPFKLLKLKPHCRRLEGESHRETV